MSSQDGVVTDKLKLILSVIRFLREETKEMNPDVAESLEVGIQCLEAAYSVDFDKQNNQNDRYQAFLEVFNLGQEDQKAEEHKTNGNELMRDSKYYEAVEEYTKAILLNPKNAVYYCNRAAAYSRLNKHELALADCQNSVKLDPNYSKAYGRLGIAYSNMNQYNKALEAYKKALELDPTNVTYSENLKLAQQKVESGNDGLLRHINTVMTNPIWSSIAAQMLSDPNVSNVMSRMLRDDGQQPNFETLLQMGQDLAQQVQINNPDLVNNLRRQFGENSEGNPEDQPSQSDKKDC